MHHLFYEEKATYPICILDTSIRSDEITKAYLGPDRLPAAEVLVLTLHQAPGKKKTSASEMKTYISDELVPELECMGVEYLVCTDAEYFKVLTKSNKADANLGYVLDCVFGPWKVVYVPNHRQIFYDPDKIKAKIAQGIQALLNYRNGCYEAPGSQVIRSEAYPQTTAEIAAWLDKLLAMNCPLTIDIEAFDLKHHRAGIASISFAWTKHDGVAFLVDYAPIEGATEAPFGKQVKNEEVRTLLRDFFEKYRRRAIYHNIAFDAYILIYQLFMTDILDAAGLLHGMTVLLNNWDCTRLIAYLATNSCAGNRLSLKDQSQEFAGNYSMGDDIKDVTRIPAPKLLRYNLVDSCSTWFVWEKHWDTMLADRQDQVYEDLFKPATLDIVQMQLTGLPVNMRKVKIAKYLLQRDERKALHELQHSQLAQQFTQQLKQTWIDEKNQEWKKKRGTLADVPASVVFNPNSGPQLQSLLYEMIGLPIISYTETKQPSTEGKTLHALVNHTQDPAAKTFLQALIDFKAVSKILTDFIPSFEDAIPGPDGWHYLCGNFNLGGTISGRLSSSDPNLQNLPANSKYAKLIKWCVEAPPGWIFAGLDFNSLEDRISALTTKDPNKIKVYTDGYDGHSLRALAYFGDQMPDIDPNSVESVNSIQKKYKPLRQDSKAPTFALTYQGTWATLVTNCGFPPNLAQQIEQRYHELYRVSDEWVAQKLNQACKDGFVTVAFGLRVRTPLLAQVIRNTRKTPHEAEAEGRSAGNALGQSWCLLNSRACSEFMGRVRKELYRLDIRPCAQIHDAQYYLLRDDTKVVEYTNRHLVKAVEWQEHPDIWHDQVKLGGELSLFYPDWSSEIGIPPDAAAADLPGIVEKTLRK